ncbi:unnamed protein product [Chironomus riparius]|uniref:Uncharacterized protein n=1 Tax=Chironomus riparius TaxID=315576 RepID=A0A9N9RTK9_9DIPT|nr:unnamed protein product [Chironomus riparius]
MHLQSLIIVISQLSLIFLTPFNMLYTFVHKNSLQSRDIAVIFNLTNCITLVSYKRNKITEFSCAI